MRALALEYHDIVPDGDFGCSGFPGKDADNYKLEASRFEAHLDALEKTNLPVDKVGDVQLPDPFRCLTFDDGGAGGYHHAAPALEARGMRGHFLIATGSIDSPGFMTRQMIGELARRGHVIGAHTENHPLMMASLPSARIDEEWRLSTSKLAEITGSATIVASISGGQYSREVAELAERNGIRFLYTSEPSSRCFYVGDCLVIGRYTLKRDAQASLVAAIHEGAAWPRSVMWLQWNSKKVAKKILGPAYLTLRSRILQRGRNGV